MQDDRLDVPCSTGFKSRVAAAAATAAEIRRDATATLTTPFALVPKAKELGAKATGILVFPSVVKGGFLVGGLFGEGVLLKSGKAVAYYNTVAASYGLQAGVQIYRYALFFMNEGALKYLDKSDGWELGTGPSIVIVDKGAAAGISTSTNPRRHLRVQRRSEGPHGRHRPAGLQDHEDHEVTARARGRAEGIIDRVGTRLGRMAYLTWAFR